MISTFRRLAMSVAMAFILSLQVSATQFIKEVMLIGGSKGADVSELDGLKQQLIADGWTFMDYDLNKGGYGCYIFMLYKADDITDGVNRGYITDFFMTNQTGTVPETFVNNGRTYHLVPYDGKWDFTNKQGNLNAGTGDVGEDIHLYYTKDAFPSSQAISTIFFSQWKDEPVVHLNGGSTLGDFNLGCTGYQDVFLHFTKATVHDNQLPVSELTTCSLDRFQLTVSGSAYDPDDPAQPVSVKVSVYYGDSSSLICEGNITGNPGFSYTTSITSPASFTVKVYARDLNTGEYVQIGQDRTVSNNLVDLGWGDDEITLNYGDILTGTGNSDTHVTITDGATVVLYHVENAYITCAGNATIILMEQNHLRGGYQNCPGIQAGPAGKTLTICGDGSLFATGNGNGAGIGGTVIIEGNVIDRLPQSSVIYNPQDSVTISTVTFNPNGGTGSAQERELLYYHPERLTNSFSRANHHFVGWNTAPDGSGTAYADGQYIFNLSSTTLYAQWEPVSTSVAFVKEGFGTYFNSRADAQLPAGMKARIITAQAGGQDLTYQTVADGDLTDAATNVVPAGTAVMLQIAPSNADRNINVTQTLPAAPAVNQNNLLHGSDLETTTTGGDLFYQLSYNRDGAQKTIGWYWGAQNAGAFTSGAHKAWLALPSDGQHAPVMGIGIPDFYEGTTDVTIITSPTASDDVWYDIYGRQLTGEPSAKGVYLHGGKTIMIK